MDRLTTRDEFGNADIIGVDSMTLQSHLDFNSLNRVTDALNRLAAYEDTGLGPEEIIPAVDVAEVRYGRWVKQKCQGDYGLCSECNCRIPWIPQNYKYCPNCGAKMDGGNKYEAD